MSMTMNEPGRANARDEERFVREMFLVPNPSKHWLAHRIVSATRPREPLAVPPEVATRPTLLARLARLFRG